jgi:dipeptidase
MCDSVVALGQHTAQGVTLYAKNSDRSIGECQPFAQHPGAFHPRGATTRCTHVKIPQVAETYRVMGHSPWWVWGFEQGVNEHGVAIGNQSVFSREPVEAQPGLIGMDLVRLGLERGRDAREALEMIAALLEQHGQGGPGFGPGESGYHNSFMIADPEQAWVLETSGRRWAARRVDQEALSNHISLGANWTIGSRDLESHARVAGWWSGSDRLDVASAYRNPDVPGRLSEGRLQRSRGLLAAGRGKHDVESMAALLRDHGEGSPLPPENRAADDDARYTLCSHAEPFGTTTASLIAPLPTDRTPPWPVWISFASPCTSVFLPVYIDGVLPAVLARGAGQADQSGSGSAWWTFHRLTEAAARDFSASLPLLAARWSTFSERVDAGRGPVESEAHILAVAGEVEEAAGLLSDFMQRVVEDALDEARRLEALLRR